MGHKDKRFPGTDITKAELVTNKRGKASEIEKAKQTFDPKEHREHIFGGHVETYYKSLKGENPQKFAKQFSRWERPSEPNPLPISTRRSTPPSALSPLPSTLPPQRSAELKPLRREEESSRNPRPDTTLDKETPSPRTPRSTPSSNTEDSPTPSVKLELPPRCKSSWRTTEPDRKVTKPTL